MENLDTSITVSILAMTVIFITLSALIVLIKVLVSLLPYTAPSPSLTDRKVASTANNETSEYVAVIHATLSHYLGKRPEEIQITEIRPL